MSVHDIVEIEVDCCCLDSVDLRLEDGKLVADVCLEECDEIGVIPRFRHVRENTIISAGSNAFEVEVDTKTLKEALQKIGFNL